MLHRARYTPYLGHTSHYRDTGARNGPPSIDVVNPATSQVLCTVVSATTEDVSTAIGDADRTFRAGMWSKSPPIHRSVILSRLARILERRIPELAEIETLQTGRTIREMRAQLGRLPEWLDYYAALLRADLGIVAPSQGRLLNYIQRVPLGVVAQITPFNHPLLIAVKKIAPALAAGNSVIVKPSELAPITVLHFAEMAEEAGVPPGVLSVLPGYGVTTGRELVDNPIIRKVDITVSSTRVGRSLGSIVGSNLAAYTAELGGKAPIIVFDDANLESAVNGVAFASFVASGQTCVSGTRIIIQDKIYDDFMTAFLRKVQSIRLRMGDPLNTKSTMGTVISLRHLQYIEDVIRRQKTGKILCGGDRMMGKSVLDGFDFSRGSFFPPTVIEGISTEDELWREEVFGPVTVVKRFSTQEEAIRLANNCRYGLGSGVWTSDVSKAHRISAELETGLCWVNTHHRNDPSSPWGGMKDSGVGRENGLEAFHAYSQSKSIIVNIATPEETLRDDDWFADDVDGKRYG